jgi:hypothetical protein
MNSLRPLGLLCAALSMLVLPTAALTQDGETPVNEGICDGLESATPGLYGLCVGFCEAQDCKGTFDPNNDEYALDPSCKPSSSKLLENYNKKKQPGEPTMPCINVVQNECPCWTEEELDTIADGILTACQADPNNAAIIGLDSGTQELEFASASDNFIGEPGPVCQYQSETPAIIRFVSITPEAFEVCRQSISTECVDRGF